MAGRSTIRDVAKAAGLSIASVSRALANPDQVREETRIRVFEAAKALGFQANRQAVDFRRGRSNAIIVLVSDIANPFYAEFFAAIEAEARRNKFIVLIGDATNGGAGEADYVAMLWAGKADGLIANIGHFPKGLPPVAEGRYQGPPMVSCNRDAGDGVPTVRIDNYAAGREVGRHLADLGHRHLAQVHGLLSYHDNRGRFAGFLDGVAERGVAPDSVACQPGGQTAKSGREAARILMAANPRPTAIFVHSDEMALGVIQQLTMEGIRIPDDVSLVGFDDLSYAAALTPPLTTMRIPRSTWGQAACARLVDQIMNGVEDVSDVTIPAEFMIRGSTGPAPRAPRGKGRSAGD